MPSPSKSEPVDRALLRKGVVHGLSLRHLAVEKIPSGLCFQALASSCLRLHSRIFAGSVHVCLYGQLLLCLEQSACIESSSRDGWDQSPIFEDAGRRHPPTDRSPFQGRVWNRSLAFALEVLKDLGSRELC